MVLKALFGYQGGNGGVEKPFLKNFFTNEKRRKVNNRDFLPQFNFKPKARPKPQKISVLLGSDAMTIVERVQFLVREKFAGKHNAYQEAFAVFSQIQR